jgi:16S rRNA (uracil1498-N3)-methyltransferase
MKIVARIFQNVPIALSQTVHLNDEASHHLTRVLRVKSGDVITLFNGEGGEYQAEIKHIGKKEVVVFILSYSAEVVESPLKIYLAQGIARGEKMDFIIQKAVELGVHTVIPLMTERSNVKLEGPREKKRILHWQAVAISACEQSGRTFIPKIVSPISLHDWLEVIKEEMRESHRFILLPHLPLEENKPVLANAKGDKFVRPVVILIGPEGGFSEQEINAAMLHGFLPLNLGPRVLRTETASIASIAILQYCFGDMAKK